MGKIDYSEINPNKLYKKESTQGEYLDVCVFNHYSSFDENNLASVEDRLRKENLSYVITLVDVGDDFKDNTRLNSILTRFPNTRIFLPNEDLRWHETFNLYVNESKANFILFLSSDLSLKEFSLQEIIKKYRMENTLFAVVPEYFINDQSEETFYSLSLTGDDVFLRLDGYHPEKRSILPYKLSAFVDKEKYQAAGGLDPFFSGMMISLLDLSYRIYCVGGGISGCNNFQVEEIKQNNKKREKRKEAEVSKSDLQVFYIKNITDFPVFNKIFKFVFFSLLRLELVRLTKFISLIKKRKEHHDERLLSDLEIMRQFT